MHCSFFHQETLVICYLALDVFLGFVVLFFDSNGRIVPCKMSFKALQFVLKPFVSSVQVVLKSIHQLILNPNLIELRLDGVVELTHLRMKLQRIIISNIRRFRNLSISGKNFLVVSDTLCHYFNLRLPLLRFRLDQLNIVNQILTIVLIIKFQILLESIDHLLLLFGVRDHFNIRDLIPILHIPVVVIPISFLYGPPLILQALEPFFKFQISLDCHVNSFFQQNYLLTQIFDCLLVLRVSFMHF